MGRVKPEAIKRLARELLEKYPERFTADYEVNKKLLMELTLFHSKKLRNRVAGYISRLKCMEQKTGGAPAAT